MRDKQSTCTKVIAMSFVRCNKSNVFNSRINFNFICNTNHKLAISNKIQIKIQYYSMEKALKISYSLGKSNLVEVGVVRSGVAS